MKPDLKRDNRSSTRGRTFSALENEIRKIVDAIDERYRRNHSEAPDDGRPHFSTGRGTLGGPGNFGGGNLDLFQPQPDEGE